MQEAGIIPPKGSLGQAGRKALSLFLFYFVLFHVCLHAFLLIWCMGGGSHIEPLHARQSVLALGYIPVFSVSSYTAGFVLFLQHTSSSCALK